jgi:hypothetical protein
MIQTQRTPRELIARRMSLRAWRGTPGDLMTIVRRMRALITPQREKALERRRAEIERFFDQQIREARTAQPSEQLPAAIDALLKAKADAQAQAVAEVVGLTAYEELSSVTLETDIIVVREAESLFTTADFPARVKAVNMTVQTGSIGQIAVALANANPYVPQLDVYVSGDDPAWVEGSVRSMMEVIERGQPAALKHWRWWVQPIVLPILAWAFSAWFLAVLFEYLRVPILSEYPWLSIFSAALPAAGVLWLLQRAIPPFAVSRTPQETSTDVVRGVIVTLIGAAVVWALGKIGLWLTTRIR